ncbi:MAG: N-acetylmuramoyl-L-alanine amidase [Verrucomicrobiota bacterium]
MFKPAVIIFGAAIFFAGCSTMPRQFANEPLNWAETNAVQRPFTPRRPGQVTPVVKLSRPPAIAPKPAPSAPVMTWISLDNWAAQRGIGRPHLLSDLPVTTYAIGSSNGVMLLEIGSRDATWNGVQINLGFEPQIIDDQIFAHGLDLQKNLEPLLCEPPLAPPQNNRVIVIDPGHGGINSGTHSVLDGRLEKEFTLDWAMRLVPLLEQEGWQVFLTHTNDVDVPLIDRVMFAEAHHADLFISLHFNSLAPDKKPAGLETYCLTPTGMPSTLTRGNDDIWTENFPNNAYDAQNLKLAVHLHTALLRATGLEDRGVNRARFIGVLHRQQRPAVLIEAGFLSNPSDAKLIETPSFRQKLAEAVADALE